ncbi:sensor histidine kinase [Cohnella sp. GbtcB17]|uniref:sensor histidine kinase n=1 Tax=Cohnella sp. GbtcB17 TaxID=2824762 RepID=UPI001C2F8660|nr:sensor histidine kinase [Cohnella sp. GbtcB17]
MLFLFLTLMLVSALLLRFNPRRPDVRWLVFFLLAWALGAFGYFIEEYVTPTARTPAFWNSLRSWLKLLGDSAAPYAFLMFAIVYSAAARGRRRALWSALLALPPLYVYYLMPHPSQGGSYTILSVYFVPYYVAGAAILIVSWLRERNLSVRPEKLATAALIVPPVLAYTWFDNHIKAVWSFRYYRYVPLLICATAFLIVFALLASKQGVLGVRLLLRRQMIDETRRGIASGASMINHALKNRLINIELLARETQEQSKDAGQAENMALILAEARHMRTLVGQIQKQVEDIRLTVTDCDVGDLLREAAAAHQVAMTGQGIELILDIPKGAGAGARADAVHLREVFGNLIRNAVEAIHRTEGGFIAIRLIERPGAIEIRIADNGTGLAEAEPDKIFQPFYSTKSNADNFGLGLSYCYSVVQKHGGAIEAHSRPGDGATFILRLPAGRSQSTPSYFG